MPEPISDTVRKIIGKKLRAYREESKLSLRELAVITDIGHSWIAKVEKGQINFQIESLTRLVEALGIQPRELFNLDLPFDD